MGAVAKQGMRLCGVHQEPAPTPTRRSSRSRSRARDPPPGEEEGDERAEGEGDERTRRRGRAREVAYQTEEAENILREVREEKEEEPPALRRRRVASPGHTPKSSVQHSLARMGMINSPDRRADMTYLEEFMEQMADGRELQLSEEDIRKQLAAQAGLTVGDLTRYLYEQAMEEQRKGTKGLTKFLAKWRQQAAARERPSSLSEWSVVEKERDGAAPTPSSMASGAQSVVSSGPVETPPKKRLASVPPPGIYDPDRKAGTGPEERGGQSEMTDIAKAIQQQTNELATLVKAQQETTTGAGGSLKSLGKTSEELVFLLRGCGQYTVQVGNEEYGAPLAQALLAAQAGSSTKLRSAGFRQKVTSRLAIGIAGPYWGTQEEYALSASDFVPCTDAELDQFAIESRTGKPTNEQRPTAPTRYEDWLNRVKRQNDIWALVYGMEWKAVREHAINLLGEWHVSAPHKWPLQVLLDVWEELHWRFLEELKEELRKIKRLSGRESMTLQDLKFYALMPDEEGRPPLNLPQTFDLRRPDGWFMSEVMPRIERRQERMLWKMTWEGSGKSRAQGQPAGGDGGSREEKPTLKTLFGPKLTAEETTRAKDRAPTNKEGKLLCWGYLTHLGCSQQGCQRAHEPLRGPFEALDPAVQLQMLRRGGLRRMKAETKESAVEKIKEIRAGVAKDKAAKVQDGKDRRRAGQGDPAKEGEAEGPEKAGGQVHWEAPEEMVQVDYTHQEKDFADLVAGPDASLFEHVPREAKPHAGRKGSTAPSEAQDMVRKAQALASGPVLGKLQGASDDLYAWASTRVANDPEIAFDTLMEEMVQYGLGELAAEAAALLEAYGQGLKAGHQARCQLEDTRWEGEGPGRSLAHIDGVPWALWDFGEMVHMTEELAGLLGVIEPGKEKRQCVTKVLAAGLHLAQHGKVPAMNEVERATQEFRLEQARLAVEAEGVMGHPETKVAPVEHELRMYAHDILKPHHDKDYRALAVFPLAAMEEIRVVVVRVDYKGDLLIETVTGSQWSISDVWVMISKGHMTLLQPPSPDEGRALLEKEEVYNTPCLGFRYFWHQRHDQAKTAPGVISCRHCRSRKGGSAEDTETTGCLRKTTCLPALSQVFAGGAKSFAPYMKPEVTRAWCCRSTLLAMESSPRVGELQTRRL